MRCAIQSQAKRLSLLDCTTNHNNMFVDKDEKKESKEEKKEELKESLTKKMTKFLHLISGAKKW